MRWALLWLCLCAVAWAEGGLRIEISGEHVLAQGQVTLAAIAAISGPDDLVSAVGAVVIRDLPDAGRRIVRADEVRAVLGRNLPGIDAEVIGQANVRRSVRTFAAADFAAAARTHFLHRVEETGDDIALQVDLLRANGSVTVLADARPCRLVAEPLAAGTLGEVPYRVKVMRDDREVGRGMVVLRVVGFRMQAVAIRDLPAGHICGPADLRLARVPIGDLDERDLRLDELVGRETRRAIAAGDAVDDRNTRALPEVRSGSTLTLWYVGQRFSVSAQAVAMGSGSIGDVITVRRVDGTQVRARVTAKGEASVATP